MRWLILFIIHSTFFSLCFIDSAAQITFQKTYGGNLNDAAYSVQQTVDGGYILCGSTASFGPGSYEYYLVKTDSIGNIIWTKTLGGPITDIANCVQNTPDGGFIIGGQLSIIPSGNVTKIDSSGNITWSKRYSAPGDVWVNYMEQTLDGGYIATGTYQDVNIFNSDHDFYILKIDSTGNITWWKIYVFSQDWDESYSVHQTPDGGYIAAGRTDNSSGRLSLLKTDSNGNLLWAKTYSALNGVMGFSMQIANDGSYIIAGLAAHFSLFNHTYLLKTDTSGNPLWSKVYGDTLSWCHFVRQTADAGYMLVGERQDTSSVYPDALFMKTDSVGNLQWARIYGGPDAESGKSGLQSADGGYVIAGYTSLGIQGSSDAYLIKTNSSGQSFCHENNIAFTDSSVITAMTSISIMDTAVGSANTFSPTVSNGGVVTLLCLSLGEEEIMVSTEGDGISIYPNPAGNELKINRDVSGSELRIEYIEIHNAFGERVYKSEMLQQENKINISHFASGVYFLTLVDGNKSKVIKKFVKM